MRGPGAECTERAVPCHRRPGFLGHLRERDEARDAGGVDEDLHRPDLAPQALDRGVHARGRRHVGLYRPARAWLFAILLFLAIPVSTAYADSINFFPGGAGPEPLYQTAIALVPTLIGAYVGAAVGWTLRRSRA